MVLISESLEIFVLLRLLSVDYLNPHAQPRALLFTKSKLMRSCYCHFATNFEELQENIHTIYSRFTVGFILVKSHVVSLFSFFQFGKKVLVQK